MTAPPLPARRPSAGAWRAGGRQPPEFPAGGGVAWRLHPTGRFRLASSGPDHADGAVAADVRRAEVVEVGPGGGVVAYHGAAVGHVQRPGSGGVDAAALAVDGGAEVEVTLGDVVRNGAAAERQRAGVVDAAALAVAGDRAYGEPVPSVVSPGRPVV